MRDQYQGRILARVDDRDFVGREPELTAIVKAAETAASLRSNLLLLGARHVGKTEILLRAFDRLFSNSGPCIPIYYKFGRDQFDPARLAADLTLHILVQTLAFRLRAPRLISEFTGPLDTLENHANRDDLPWVREILGRLQTPRNGGNLFSSLPVIARRTGLIPVLMLDDAHRLIDTGPSRPEPAAAVTGQMAFDDLLAAMSSPGWRESVFVLTGQERPLAESVPPYEELLERLQLLRVSPLGDRSIAGIVRRTAAELNVEMSESTTELMVQQLGGDLFYSRAVLNAAAAAGAALKTFVDFERVYTDQVLNGRIGQFFNALFRSIAPGFRERRAMIDTLRLVTEARGPVPIEAVADRLLQNGAEPEEMLNRLRWNELMDAGYGFASASADPVVGDYVRAVYRNEIVGARPAIAGEELLRDKLKSSYRLMMSRYNRSVQSQLIELLSRFDFQSAPASLFDQAKFDERYRAQSRVQTRRLLEDEEPRLRLPQLVLVNDAGSVAAEPANWRFFTASGFEGGIYSEANEVEWLVALINSREPVDAETLESVDNRLESGVRSRRDPENPPAVTRWYISKEGFVSSLLGSQRGDDRYFSTFVQLDLLHDWIFGASGRESEIRSFAEFELTIPASDESELIAARTVEQIARAADFEQETINQIKTALIEACINAAEHSDSPDRKIYQRFSLSNDRLVISVNNKGKALGFGEDRPTPTAGVEAGSLKGSRGRGLQIIRALMDDVHFERTDDGTTLVMTKYLKRPNAD
jgi:serine/threonine-protein kinase RsbW